MASPPSSTARADAILPPPPDKEEERGSSRRLDDVGVENVLHAMVEQRRASRPAPEELEQADQRAGELDYVETPRSRRVPADSDAFLKAR
jgi:hypothetical protein